MKITTHGIDMINKRFETNNINKTSYVINTFKTLLKKQKTKVWLKIVSLWVGEYRWKKQETFKMYFREFKYIYARYEWWAIDLITFAIRSPQ
jgi:hypothetical protein